MSRSCPIVLLLANPATHDSRNLRMAGTLAAAGYRVTLAATATAELPEHEEREGFRIVRVAVPGGLRWLPAPRLPGAIEARSGGAGRPGAGAPRQGSSALARLATEGPGRLLQAIRYLLVSRRWADAIARAVGPAELWQAEGLVMLPIATRLRRRFGGRVIYDSLEVSVESGRFALLPGPWRRLLAWRERRWVRSVDAVLTVNEPCAEVLAGRLGVRPGIVMNCPPSFTPSEPRERRFHRLLGLADDVPVVLYHGAVFPGRGLEQLLEAIGLLPRAALVVMGYGSALETYRSAAMALPHGAQIHFVPAVAPDELLAWVACADVAAMPLQGDTLNHRLATPNKLFEAMAAGVPVVASELPGMAPIVHGAGVGRTCDPTDPADIAGAIRAILYAPPAERAGLRERCLVAAATTYNWEGQGAAYLALLDVLDAG